MTGNTGLILRRSAAIAMVALLCACQKGEQIKKAPDRENKYTDRLQITDLANALQTAPDEFSVITKRPLEMPGSFAALPPPEPGKPSTRDPNPMADARAALAFEPVPASTGPYAPSTTETAILSSAGAADPSIRATLATEQEIYEAEQNVYLLDRLIPQLRAARGDLYRDAIDAEEERVRLQQAGVTPQAGGIAPTPVSTPAQVYAPVVATPVTPGTPPAPTSSVPTFGVLAPEAASTAPPLIYLPE